MTTNYFLQTLRHLRDYEEVMLYGNLLLFTEADQQEATDYLAKEYKSESLNYPFTPPPFNAQAALWAARTIYTATQLMLYRENKEADLSTLLPPYAGEITPSAVLSADLVMRFIPDVIRHLKVIDSEDKLVEVLEAHLKLWHYSGLAYPLSAGELEFSTITASDCLLQLYIDRVIENRNTTLSGHPALEQGLKAGMGMFRDVYWSGFKQATPENEHD